MWSIYQEASEADESSVSGMALYIKSKPVTASCHWIITGTFDTCLELMSAEMGWCRMLADIICLMSERIHCNMLPDSFFRIVYLYNA